MLIKEIEIDNFRIYKGVNIINILPQSSKNIIIISGKNGYGKTTFLMSLVWCLFGRQMQDVDEFYYKEISDQGGYSKYIGSSLNRLVKAENETRFSVSITIVDVDIPELPCKEIKIKRSYDIISTTTEEVEILIDGYTNELTTELGPEAFIRDFILPKEIAKFFLFDAEKIVSLAEITSTDERKKLSQAYSEVLGIKKHEDLRINLEDYLNKLKRESASEREKKQLNSIEAEIKNHNLSLENIDIEKKNLKESKTQKIFESRQIEDLLIKEGDTISLAELNELRDSEATLTSKLNDIQNELRDSYEMIPFGILGENLTELLEQLDYELKYNKEKFQKSRIEEIKKKIISELEKVIDVYPKEIDKKIHHLYVDIFETLIDKYFFKDTLELPEDFQVFHNFSEPETTELITLINNLKSSFREKFVRISGDYNQYRNELNAIKRKIRDAEAHQELDYITELRKNKNELDIAVIRIDEKIEELIKEKGQIELLIVQAERKRTELNKKITISKANKAKEELTKRLIKEQIAFIESFKKAKKESLEKRILSGLQTLMHMDIIKRVEVTIVSDTIDINLFNKRNELIKKESLSKGQQQIYASALLKGLVEESSFDFPVFIDSPMQKFDETHAENIIKYFYPNVSEQVVIFPLINKEINKKEFETLEKNISKTFLINNVHNDKSEFREVEPKELFNQYEILNNNAN